MFYQQEQVKGEPLFLADNTIKNAMHNAGVWDLEIIGIPARCTSIYVDKMMISFGDVDRDGKQDIVMGGKLRNDPYWCMDSVNGDSWPDLIVSRGGNTLGKNARFNNLDGDSEWGFEGLRYFVNNDVNFVENTNVFPSDLDLYAANPPSSVGTSLRNHESGGASLM